MTTVTRVALAGLCQLALVLPHGALHGLVGTLDASAQAAPPRVTAVSTDAFLTSIGVNTHIDQGYNPQAYIEGLRYTGIRQVRDGTHHILSAIQVHQATGVRFTISAGGDLAGLLSAARTLAAAHALLAIEGPNEPNNFAITYAGKRGGGRGGTWMPVAEFQRDLYGAVKADPVLHSYPVLSPSETGAETDNVGLQFLSVPPGAGTLVPDGTRFADLANVHNYVIGNGGNYGDNQAWNAADPTLRGRWDGLDGNYGVTWYQRYRGYPREALPALPRVTTETGWDSMSNPGGPRVQGCVLANTYLAQFKRGWRYTFVYEMEDGEGSTGDQGLYHGASPKPAAVYLHNLTTLLSDDGPPAEAGTLSYAIPHQPDTVHDLLLQKGGGTFELVIWDERVHGEDSVNVQLGVPHRTVNVYDITVGTKPLLTLSNATVVPLTLSDHPVIVEIGD